MWCGLRLSVPLALLILATILLSSTVEAQWVSSHDVTKFVDDVNSGVVSFEPNRTDDGVGSFLRSYTAPGMVGDGCSDEEPCQEGLKCAHVPPLLRKRCLPPTDCLASAAQEFNETFNWNQWMDGILEQANLTNEDLVEAARSATNLDDFQTQLPVVRFVNAFQTAPRPKALQGLQDAADKCMPAVMARAPTAGTIAYMGLHIEVGLLYKMAFSVYGSLGHHPDPNSWIRFSFGVEAGAGVELSWLIGFAFTGDTNLMQGAAAILDADIGAGLGAGVAFLTHLSSVFALEFTLGPAIGVGLGYGCGFIYALDRPPSPTFPPNPFAPTPAPTMRPTI